MHVYTHLLFMSYVVLLQAGVVVLNGAELQVSTYLGERAGYYLNSYIHNLILMLGDDFSEISFPTPSGSMPDEMLPLLSTHQQQPNMDILLSKLLNNDELNDIELQQLNEQERIALENVKTRNHNTKKRPDELQKLFFRRAFKFAEKQFFGKSKNKSRRMSSFYHHHFGVASQAMGVPLANFYHPDKKTRPGMRTGQKSFNLSYIKLLLRSDSFREVSRAYYRHFKADCIAERASKIPKFGIYLRGLILKHGQDPQRIQDAIYSSKCKIPWTNREIDEADKRAIAQLEQVKVQQSQKGGDEEQEQMMEQSDCQEVGSSFMDD